MHGCYLHGARSTPTQDVVATVQDHRLHDAFGIYLSLWGSAAANSPLAATITGHLSLASFYDALGRLISPSLRNAASSSGHPGRRRSPLRPSMRERAVSISLFRTLDLLDTNAPPNRSLESLDLPHRPSIFLLLSSSTTGKQTVHTHEYRAFALRLRAGGVLEPRSLDIVNVGPAFRAQYSSFSPLSA
ncbi:hypothetical protein GW17_00043293 [Ensete ventricosum]|nr:hypothetical protein GW17_00043293 [Ensete ventricosum]